MKEKMIIGRLEAIALPELSIENMTVRIDSGAKTSSLHVDNLKQITTKGKPWVSFDLHPDVHNVEKVITCSAPISDIRKVKSSNGVSEQRYVIETIVTLGKDSWPIEITLTDRSDMSYLMLFGREAMGKRFLVDPSKVYLAGSEDASQS
ncbi:ribosomal protein S6 modification protein [Thalassotalea insulae]|uniref:Ribosomal protein S6 modification protein n=1 Tax=Thalassotalea insulae TaxID=2056778 RepID=A0ABQ6GV37_9GAMM|nr:ATP-dependent zinc protease [Thalassotalea insulae]GLX79783.1 ribosomal protein S6 modification protein [Thalassotalea insulae]